MLTHPLGLTKGHPRLFWKEHEHVYTVLAKIARGILSTPASGDGSLIVLHFLGNH